VKIWYQVLGKELHALKHSLSFWAQLVWQELYFDSVSFRVIVNFSEEMLDF
jgi:hypothetical protein